MNKCEFCAMSFEINEDDELSKLLELPIEVGSGECNTEIGHFSVWIDYYGQLTAGLYFNHDRKFINVDQRKINFCPMCGRDFRIYR